MTSCPSITAKSRTRLLTRNFHPSFRNQIVPFLLTAHLGYSYRDLTLYPYYYGSSADFLIGISEGYDGCQPPGLTRIQLSFVGKASIMEAVRPCL